MPEWILPSSFISLLAPFAAVFTKPSFINFQVIVAGWVHALGAPEFRLRLPEKVGMGFDGRMFVEASYPHVHRAEGPFPARQALWACG